MKSVFTKLFLVITIAFPGLALASIETGDVMDFKALSYSKGSVVFDELEIGNGFPSVNDETAVTVRFYVSDVSFDAITENSPWVEVGIDHANSAIGFVQLGNLKSGSKYFFKLGLASREGKLLFFTPKDSIRDADHAVLVK